MTYFAHQMALAVPQLLAGQGRYMHMGRRFRRGSSNFDTADLVTLLGVLAIVAALGWLITRYLKLREKRHASSAQHLFVELCRAHQLDWPSRQLIQSLAKAHGLTNPARIFVEPHRFNADKLGPAFANCETRLTELRRQLFAESTETRAAPPTDPSPAAGR